MIFSLTQRYFCVSCKDACTLTHSLDKSLLIQLSVKECVLPMSSAATDFDLGKIKEVVERCGMVLTERKSSACPLLSSISNIQTKQSAEFIPKNIEQDLNRLLKLDASSSALRQLLCQHCSLSSTHYSCFFLCTIAEFDFKLAMGATSALVSYLSLLADVSNHGQYTLRRHDLAQFMKLDASALRALSLMPAPGVSIPHPSLLGLEMYSCSGSGSCQNDFALWATQ